MPCLYGTFCCGSMPVSIPLDLLVGCLHVFPFIISSPYFSMPFPCCFKLQNFCSCWFPPAEYWQSSSTLLNNNNYALSYDQGTFLGVKLGRWAKKQILCIHSPFILPRYSSTSTKPSPFLSMSSMVSCRGERKAAYTSVVDRDKRRYIFLPTQTCAWRTPEPCQTQEITATVARGDLYSLLVFDTGRPQQCGKVLKSEWGGVGED